MPRTLFLLLGSIISLSSYAQTSFFVGSTLVSVDVIAEDLLVPWDLVLGPDGFVWFTQASGEVYRMDPDDGSLQLVYTVPDVHEFGFTAGLHSMAFHPDFTSEPYVYLHYTISTTESVIKRFLYDASSSSFTSMSDHLLSLPIAAGPSHNGSRIITDDTGMFLISIGETMSASASAQDLNTSHGKILRFAPDGSIPADNPIPGSYVYNWGHRNPQGLVRAASGIIYNSAHGQSNDDEVNIVLPDRNYGWPTVLGLCNTPTEIAYCEANDVVEPIHEFTAEVVAPSGMDHFDHPSIPGWQNSLLVATLRGKELRQLQLDATGEAVITDNSFLSNAYGRLRDVLVLPDGRILICTSNHDWSGTPTATDDRILVLRGDAPTALNGPAARVVVVHPNPSNGMIQMDVDLRSFAILDATGRRVLERPAMSRSIDTSMLTPGSYTLHGIDALGQPCIARLLVAPTQ